MTAFIIRASIDRAVTDGMFARDWFDCGVNSRSERFATEADAIAAARAGYHGPDFGGLGCRFWAQQVK